MDISLNAYLYPVNCLVILATFIYFNWDNGADLTIGPLMGMIIISLIPFLNWMVFIYIVVREIYEKLCRHGEIILLKGRVRK